MDVLVPHLQQHFLLQVFICSVQQLLGPQYSVPHHVFSTTSKGAKHKRKGQDWHLAVHLEVK